MAKTTPKNKQYYIVKIEIESNEYDYSVGQIIQIPVQTNTEMRAWDKVSNTYCGSEFPKYKVISIYKCDQFIFRPLI